MKNIKVVLLADTRAMERRIYGILTRDAGIDVLLKPDIRDEMKLLMEQDAVLFACENPAFLRREISLMRALLAAGSSVICIGGQPDVAEELAKLDGCSFIACGRTQEAREQVLFEKELLVKVKSCYKSAGERRMQAGNPPSRHLIGVGASTGGPGALLSVLKNLSPDTCGILVVQHLSSGFAENFAQYMDQKCRMQVKLAAPDETVRDGVIYLAAERCQMTVTGEGNLFRLHSRPGKRGYEFCPSIDCLFESMAESAGKRAMGIILTGMGADGADGLLKMRNAGAYTIGQDRETSAIYSMPQEAARMGAVIRQLPVGAIAGEAEQFDRKMKKKWEEL